MPRRRRQEHAIRHESDDAIKNFVEWQEHQYVPGYYVGGRIPYFLLGSRPNKYGYALLASGILSIGLFMIVLLGSTVFRGDMVPRNTNLLDLAPVVIIGISGAVEMIAGICLLRRPIESKSRQHDD